MHRFLPLLTAVALLGCGDAGSDSISSDESTLATVDLELTLGAGSTAGEDHSFGAILDVLRMPDETVWIIDQPADSTRIRRYDVEGDFLGWVSRPGIGVGRYLEPVSLTPLPDDRVLVVDPAYTGYLNIFGPDGEFADTITFPEARFWHESGRTAVDDQGVVWILSGGSMVPPGIRLPLHFTRVTLDGAVLDTAHVPPLPEVERRFVRVRTLSGYQSYQLPYQPGVSWVVGPRGRFVVAREDEYRIVRVGSPDAEADTAVVIAARDLPAIPVSDRERAELRDSLEARARRLPGQVEVEIPEIPTVKPPVRDIRFARDGHLLVQVSLPSERVEGRWVEPGGWDVFSPDGDFRGRIVLPHDVELRELAGDHVWAVRAEGDAGTVLRYRITWPDPR